MKPILLIDFGSTYTKVTAVDADEGIPREPPGKFLTQIFCAGTEIYRNKLAHFQNSQSVMMPR